LKRVAYKKKSKGTGNDALSLVPTCKDHIRKTSSVLYNYIAQKNLT
jgi:hypothetical protein